MGSVIQVPSCPGRGALHSRITCSNCASSVTVNPGSGAASRFSCLPSERLTRNSAGRITMRGSWLHHSTGSSAEYQGKMPAP